MCTGCQQNVASLPARTSPLSAGWDSIRPPRHRHCCHCRPVISTVAHPRYPPDADPGHARRRVFSPSSACCQSRPAERSLSTSSRIAIVCGVVGCDPPSTTPSPLLPSRHNLCRCPFLVSARRGPRTRPLTCSSSTPSSTSPSPLCPPPVTGQVVWHVPPHIVIVVVIFTSSQGC